MDHESKKQNRNTGLRAELADWKRGGFFQSTLGRADVGQMFGGQSKSPIETQSVTATKRKKILVSHTPTRRLMRSQWR
jgi:hypothetical protein